MKRLCLKTFRLINKDYIEGKKLMSEPEGIFNWNTVVCVSRDYCQVILETFLILPNAGGKILEVKSLNKSNAFFFLLFFEEKNILSKLKCLVSMNDLRSD